MSSAPVLDSHALLVYFRAEAGDALVKDLLTKAAASQRPLHMSEISYAKLKSTLIRSNGLNEWERTAAILGSLPIAYHDVTRKTADAAADIVTNHLVSIATAFTAALALEINAPVLTNSNEFKALEKEIKIIWLR